MLAPMTGACLLAYISDICCGRHRFEPMPKRLLTLHSEKRVLSAIFEVS